MCPTVEMKPPKAQAGIQTRAKWLESSPEEPRRHGHPESLQNGLTNLPESMHHRVKRPESLNNMAQPHTYLQTQLHTRPASNMRPTVEMKPAQDQAGAPNTGKMTRNKVQEERRRHGHPESLQHGLTHLPEACTTESHGQSHSYTTWPSPHTYLQTRWLHTRPATSMFPKVEMKPPKAQAGTQNTGKMTRIKVQEEPRRHGHPESLTKWFDTPAWSMHHRVTQPESLMYNIAQPHTYLQTQWLHTRPATNMCPTVDMKPPKAQAGTPNTGRMTRIKVQEELRRHGHPESPRPEACTTQSHTHTASMSAHKTYRPAAPHGRNETHMTHLLQKNPKQRKNSNLSHPKNTTHARNMPKKNPARSKKNPAPLRATAACHFLTSELPKWLRHWGLCAFWLKNVLRATAACHFSTSELQKVLRPWGVLYILT